MATPSSWPVTKITGRQEAQSAPQEWFSKASPRTYLHRPYRVKRVIFADIATSGNRPSHVRPRDLHEALAVAEQATAQWKALYAARAGVEGTMRQATHVTGSAGPATSDCPRPSSSTPSPPPRST